MCILCYNPMSTPKKLMNDHVCAVELHTLSFFIIAMGAPGLEQGNLCFFIFQSTSVSKCRWLCSFITTLHTSNLLLSLILLLIVLQSCRCGWSTYGVSCSMHSWMRIDVFFGELRCCQYCRCTEM